jgi:hypothetical protein
VLALVLATASIAHAQLDVGAEERARLLFDEGRALVDAGRYDDAVEKFEESLALLPRTATEVNLAVALAHAGRVRAATERFEALLDGGELTEEQRADVARRLEQARAALARLRVSVHGVSAITVEVDGVALGTAGEGADVAFAIDPGTHRVVARSGARAWPARVLDAAAGTEHTMRFDALELAVPDEPAPPPHAPAVADDGGGSSTGWWIALGVGVAVAAAVAVTLVLVLDADEPVVGRGVTLSF